MKLTGEDLRLMCNICPEFKSYVAVEDSQKVLYLRLERALYGCIQSALLWYKLFMKHLTELGFELNRSDSCVANATINDKQCTIAWYVDDNKISHEDPAIVESIMALIEKLFGTMVKNTWEDTRDSGHEFHPKR